jgi:tetratricopeptide (TPR) repeat protein
MYDLKPLEEEWEKYHKKKNLPLYLGAFLGFLLISGIGILVYNNYFSNNNNIVKIENNASSPVQINNVPDKASNKILKEEVNNTIVKEEIKKSIPTEMIVDNIPILENKRETEVDNKSTKKIHLNIIESSSVDAYEDVEKRFFKSRDVDDSLFLAKAYYSIGKYKKSEHWALQTNKINSTIDESWIIFAQSKVKLGQRSEAISILNNYIQRTGSERAKNSLLKISK